MSKPALEIPEALVLRAQAGDQRAANEVVRAMWPTVERIARDWQRHADLNDLVSEGLEGVAAALRNWKPGPNAAPFPAWARKHVFGAVSRYAAENASMVKLGSKDHATMLGGSASARAKLAPRLGVNQRSLDEPAGPDMKMTLGEAMASPLPTIEEALAGRGEEDSRVDLLEALLEQMPELERAVLEVRYFVGSSIAMSKRGAALLVEYARAQAQARKDLLGKSKKSAKPEAVESVKLRDLAKLLQMDKEQARQAELRGLDMLARALVPGRNVSAKVISQLLSPDTRTRLAKKGPKQLGLFGAETLGEKPRCRFCHRPRHREDPAPGQTVGMLREVCKVHVWRKEKCPACGRCLPYRDQCGRQLTYCGRPQCRKKGQRLRLRSAESRKAARTLIAPMAHRQSP